MAEFDSKDFGERLKNYRIQKGLSQENMAILLNKNRSTIARYEAGEILPDVRDISIICEELGIKYQYLADNWIYHLEYKNKNRYIAGYKFDLNPQGLGYILDDKYAFYELITKKGFKSTTYHLIYQNYNQHMIKELFNKYHQEVVIKSNNGTCGEEVFYVNNEEKLFQIIILKWLQLD